MKKAFNMNARIVKLLGEKNVPNSQAAITELVKNCYDAEGRIGLVLFEYDTNNEVKSIYIIDNGVGMDENTIDKYWMTIGTDNKEVNFKTSDGRVQSGAMGIGRLSLDRLGNRTNMFTQQKDKPLVNWTVCWEDFNKSNKNVNEVFAEIVTVNENIVEKIIELCETFPALKSLINEYDFYSGTIIEISELKDNWDNTKINALIDYLDMIVPPTDVSKFSIFSIKSIDDSYRRAVPIISDDFDYKIKASSHSQGVKIEVFRDEFDTSKLDLDILKEDKMGEFPFDKLTLQNRYYILDLSYGELVPSDNKIINKEIFDLVGEFHLDFYFLKQTVGSSDNKYPYKHFDESARKDWLQNFSGMKIYRDNFRVRPYGEKNSNTFDWLDLQERVRKSPAAPSHLKGRWHVRSNQVAGNLSISRINNPNIQDMSNRQSLDENKAFIYLKNLIIAIIDIFEKDRQTIMRSIVKVQEKKNPDYELNKKAKVIAQKINKLKPLQENNNEVKQNNVSLSIDEQRILAQSYSKREKEYKKEKADLVSENQLLRVMATTGVTMSSFGHELKSISALLGNRIRILNTVLENQLSKQDMLLLNDQDDNPYVFLKDLEKTDNQIKNWIAITLSNIMRDKRNRKTFDLVKCLDDYIKIWDKIMDDNDSKIIFNKPSGECKIKAFESDFESILGNLFSNSVEAFKREDANSERVITISMHEGEEEYKIDYRDSGPGLSKDILNYDTIFDHLFTTKRDKDGKEIGTGLGMWIVKNIVVDNNGRILIQSPSEPFNILITLPKYRGVKNGI